MNNYLLQILKETKTIIIPGLGALTVTNEATGEIMFMSFLKHDDGNLAKYISEKEGMDINDAKNLIAKYVREIQAEVDKGEKYSMYQFGTFYKLDGEIAFEQWSAGSPEATTASTEEKAQPEVPATPPVVETPAPVKEEPKVEAAVQPPVEEKKAEAVVEKEKPAQTPSPSEEKKPEPISAIQQEEIIVPPISEKEIKTEHSTEAVKPREEIREEVKPAPVSEEKIVVPPLEEVKPLETLQPKAPEPPKKVTAKSPKEQLKAADKQAKPAKKKKKVGVFAYILWGFVVLILGAGTYVAVKFDTLKKDFPILAELAGEEVEKEKDTTLLSLGEKDPVANPDSMPEAESVPGEDIQTETEPVEETTPEPVKKAEPVTPKPVAKPKPVEKPVVKPKPVVVKPTPQPKPKPVPTTTYSAPRPKPANFPTPNLSMPYHVIVGSFASKTNARNFATKLKGMGMSNLTIGEKDGLYKVSVNGYSTEEEAKAALPSLKDVAPNAWVFNWK